MGEDYEQYSFSLVNAFASRIMVNITDNHVSFHQLMPLKPPATYSDVGTIP